jgi:hypothetical protein
MNALDLLRALKQAAPHCEPSLGLDATGAKLVMCLHDQRKGTHFSGTFDGADLAMDPTDAAAQMAAAERRNAA